MQRLNSLGSLRCSFRPFSASRFSYSLSSVQGRGFSSQRNVIVDLKNRGFVSDLTNENLLSEGLPQGSAVYVGFDPTADSLHIGNLLSIFTLSHLQKAGYKPIALVGGATGMIGDPSGRNAERNLLDEPTLRRNVEGITSILERCLSDFQLVNNYDWYKDMNMLSFLRDVGKHFRVNMMLDKDSVRSRLDSQSGMSFTEFTYMLLQAYDFHRLYQEYNCRLQFGGADQWGNITAGIHLISRLSRSDAFGLTIPLLTNSSGEKLGKSVGGGVWMAAEKTSVYDFHQFFIRTEDSQVGRFLRLFTFLPLEEIEALEERHRQRPEEREAQRVLADHVTTFVHGKEAMEQAKEAASQLFGGDLTKAKWSTVDSQLQEAPRISLSLSAFLASDITSLAVNAKLGQSKGSQS